MGKGRNWVGYGILLAYSLSCRTAGQQSPSADGEAKALNTAQGQILGTHKGEKVCIHSFSPPDHEGEYKISTPRGTNCGENLRYAPRDEVDYGSDAFKGFLEEIPAGGMIKLNMRYATNEIFPLGDSKTPYGNGKFRIDKPLYGKARCFLHPKAAAALRQADEKLRQKNPNLRLMMLDCYRPQYVSQIMWDKVGLPDYVASSGLSGHNKGGTVDLTLARMDGNQAIELDMGSAFDLFSSISNFDSPLIPKNSQQYANRTLLLSVMKAAGFAPYGQEWWHFSMEGHSVHLDLPI